VQEFVKAHGHRRILLQELCEASGLSRRGVEYLFLDLLGLPASVFLLQSRLHGVRRELLAAGPQHGKVKECALNWGFWHLGRFAKEYHALFGEKPSETLARQIP
jgi:AraC family transcriptional regulator, ethanolamine operon transcriptional activator